MVSANNLAPSVKRQEWGLIFSLVVTIFLITYPMLIYFTWGIYSKWGSFDQHLPSLIFALEEIIFKQSLNGWDLYWNQLISYGWMIHFLLHLTIPAVISLIFSAFIGHLCYYPGGRDHLLHVSGPKLYWHKAAIKHAKNKLILECGEHKKLGLKLHPDVAITRVRESGNIFVCGSQGSGKTVFITPLIHQVISRGERAFIYDEKREFTGLFYNKNTSLLVAPWDSRGDAWNISADATNAAEAELIADRLIMDSEPPIWSTGAKIIFAGLIEILNHTRNEWGWSELADILDLDEREMNSLLELYYPRAARFIKENDKTTQSFFIQLTGSLAWVYTLAIAWPKAYENGFSVSEWIKSSKTKKKVIFVQADKRYKNIGAPVANALIALMTSNILSQSNSANREVWLFLDELANLPRNDSLREWMSLGRSKGCRIVAGTQSISQIQEIYSEKGADSLLNMFGMFVSMRLGAAGDTAAFTAQAFGERIVERPSSSVGANRETAINWHKEAQPLITASDLIHLPQAGRLGVEGFMMIPGWESVYRLRWPIPKLPVQAKEHCPADWVQGLGKKTSKIDKRIGEDRSPNRIERRRGNAVN